MCAPTPSVWPCTAAHTLGPGCARRQGLEKRLCLDHRGLAGKDLVHEDALHLLIPICTAILEHHEGIIGIGRPAHR